MARTTPELAAPPLQLPHHTSGRTFHPLCMIKRAAGDTTDLQWNRVSNQTLRPRSSPLGHRSLRPVPKQALLWKMSENIKERALPLVTHYR
ncbi:hypothetical protein AVEN_114871-1 [Araneus ventricosus]|uniref:Uncharacterized protein n=1 Tax=Araneus ventricosus TaxID=182803 RepID=A0A4Y2P434_ARAVE|nr:hypothetical protein AVEN_141271-1 [Araneus ventricosus]GBN46148.1 hypothetical protein AVEN_117722-1 [Araneus ventricosus]GBN50707.1 hypothetical protein AVEN_218115-1 [Araneus ventricosus]GBN50847.1 hypothetical protein AVEN_114871-1 [Araneus ventricosus]